MKLPPLPNALLVTALTVLTVLTSKAVPQRFGWSYETGTLARGGMEFENSVVMDYDHGDKAYEIEHELEWGVTDRLQISLLAEWEHADHDSELLGCGFEAIYNICTPSEKGIGCSLLLETKLGSEEYTIEGKVLLQKDCGAFNIVYNIGVEAIWEGDDYDEENGEFMQSIGISRKLCSSCSVSLEALHEVEWEGWDDVEANAVYIGPGLHFRHGNFWATIVAGWEITDEEEAADFKGRARFGWLF